MIFSTLCVVHDQIFQRKLSRRRLPITFVYFVSHASAQALRPITFTQRFRTTRHLISIQLLRKPEILNLEDIRTKFERSKGDLVSFQATRYVCYDQSAKFCSLILIFSTLCVVHDLIFQRKLSRRRLPITFVYFVSHASAQALRPITFTQRFRTTVRCYGPQRF